MLRKGGGRCGSGEKGRSAAESEAGDLGSGVGFEEGGEEESLGREGRRRCELERVDEVLDEGEV